MTGYAQKISKKLNIKGLMNIQYILTNDEIYVLEVNPRASRTVPLLSKCLGLDICKVATDVILGKSLSSFGFNGNIYKKSCLYGIKVPIFSCSKLPNANKLLNTEMKSTGEILGLGKSLNQAKFKALKMLNFDKTMFQRKETKEFFKNISQNSEFDVMTIDEYVKI
jgi:carbamoyl-phosphate synthase large subunit